MFQKWKLCLPHRAYQYANIWSSDSARFFHNSPPQRHLYCLKPFIYHLFWYIPTFHSIQQSWSHINFNYIIFVFIVSFLFFNKLLIFLLFVSNYNISYTPHNFCDQNLLSALLVEFNIAAPFAVQVIFWHNDTFCIPSTNF